MARYDHLGRTYSATRRADPRIATAIGRALSDTTSLVNVGAGTGSTATVATMVLSSRTFDVTVAGMIGAWPTAN